MQGLENLGSTCAVNSLIQIICRTDYLRNIILKDNVPQNTLSHELKEILDLMHNQKHSLSPKRFVNRLYQHMNGIFRQGEQIDISELWMFLYDKIANELAVSTASLECAVLDPEICIEENDDLSKCKPLFEHCDSIVGKMNGNKSSEWLASCQGIFLNMLKCNECNTINYNFEPFISIPLDIPESKDIYCPSVATMLRNYIKTQQCKGDWKCDKCKKCTVYTKIIKIWKLPHVLVFVIKRFANLAVKNIKPISVNKTLCIKESSVISNMDKDFLYECASFAMHYGSLFGGHYTSVCKIKCDSQNESDEKYYFYDDINISEMNQNNINRIYECNKDAYMIVYTLVKSC